MKRWIHAVTEPVVGMAVVDKNEFDLPYDIWLDPAGNSRNVSHSLPRVKIVVDGERIPFSIDDDPRPLVKRKIKNEKRIRDWILKK